MRSNSQRFFAKALMLALVAFLVLPMVALGQGRGRGRGKPTDIFVNGHDARDGRTDGRGPNRDGNYGDQRRRDRDDDDRWERRRDRRDRRDRRGGYNNDNYGNYGGSYQLRQTALNAGYNEGMKEGRKDRNSNDRFDYTDEGAYRNANKDYNSRLGDRYTYERYFREAFARGYRDGYGTNGYNDGYRGY